MKALIHTCPQPSQLSCSTSGFVGQSAKVKRVSSSFCSTRTHFLWISWGPLSKPRSTTRNWESPSFKEDSEDSEPGHQHGRKGGSAQTHHCRDESNTLALTRSRSVAVSIHQSVSRSVKDTVNLGSCTKWAKCHAFPKIKSHFQTPKMHFPITAKLSNSKLVVPGANRPPRSPH